ncbi:uncharacterized protein LOC131317386 [Rhododendron vialii]|uniref:uncharacterized protein LOC131317386 n=1 Tax=Rhododendron vialii TaxID=182163 RepID=UPI00265F75D0|nr:uncharacterized protein LOC131317386 [Rhododendron vialii]
MPRSVHSGKVLGHHVTIRGIEANLDQITALQRLQSLRMTKEVQRLTGMAAALNRFISRLSNNGRPFFQLLKKREGYEWGAKCEQAFQDLKKYLAVAPLLSTPEPGESLILYLAVSEHAVSAVLLRNKGPKQIQVYCVSKTLVDVEMRYLPLKKLILALRMAMWKLPHYFQSHKIVLCTTIKGQVLANFIAEFSPAVAPQPPTRNGQALGLPAEKNKALAE